MRRQFHVMIGHPVPSDLSDAGAVDQQLHRHQDAVHEHRVIGRQKQIPRRTVPRRTRPRAPAPATPSPALGCRAQSTSRRPIQTAGARPPRPDDAAPVARTACRGPRARPRAPFARTRPSPRVMARLVRATCRGTVPDSGGPDEPGHDGGDGGAASAVPRRPPSRSDRPTARSSTRRGPSAVSISVPAAKHATSAPPPPARRRTRCGCRPC